MVCFKEACDPAPWQMPPDKGARHPQQCHGRVYDKHPTIPRVIGLQAADSLCVPHRRSSGPNNGFGNRIWGEPVIPPTMVRNTRKFMSTKLNCSFYAFRIKNPDTKVKGLSRKKFHTFVICFDSKKTMEGQPCHSKIP